jgi:hypothetical protein
MVAGLNSAKLKLARAARHLRAIKQCIAVYSASQPHKIVAKARGKKKLNIPKPPPRAICILAGEMVYQMRSALDHLAYNLVKINAQGIILPAGWAENCDFPLKLRLPKNVSGTPLAYKYFSDRLPGISKPAFAFIESVQPYYRVGAVNNCLRFLAGLSNVDKHRHFNVFGTRVRKSESIRFASGLRSKSTMALDRGTNLYPIFGWNESDRAVDVHRRFRAFVNFEEEEILGEAVTLPAEYLLKLILDHINLKIVPAFEKFIKNPRVSGP